MRYRPTWGYRDDIRAIQLQARLGSILCPIWWGAMWLSVWKCLIRTDLSNMLYLQLG